MKHLSNYKSYKVFESKHRQLNDPKSAKRALSRIYDIKDEIVLIKPRTTGRHKDSGFSDFLVDIDDFINYAEKYNGNFGGNRFNTLSEFKSFLMDRVDYISPEIYVAPFWSTRTISDIVDLKDVYADTVYVKVSGDVSNFKLGDDIEEHNQLVQLNKDIEADEIRIFTGVSGQKYIRLWWD